ncbi:MAG: 30S ribosomal protein S20 [Candidatus Omnitrophica bacterium]|nr:30S ribosomal protein S20 [Candidatus Omnitrophota bacterium]MBL7210284.1 30S ribosomal protein S20 [Candidatus Omnitrophota bacterium]
MPRRKTSLKRNRADRKKRLHNLKIKQQLKKTIKKFQALLSAKKVDEAKIAIKEVFSRLDKAAKKKIIHLNTADRKKSRLSRRLKRAA